MEDINKDIEILENLLEEGFEAMCYPEAQAIEHLIQAYKELEEENKKWEKYCTEDLEKQITDLKNKIVELEHNSIPVSLVEEKIEELKSNPLKIKQNDKYYYETHAYNKIIISVLQELIEGRK